MNFSQENLLNFDLFYGVIPASSLCFIFSSIGKNYSLGLIYAALALTGIHSFATKVTLTWEAVAKRRKKLQFKFAHEL